MPELSIENCPNDCSRGGECDYATGVCKCDPLRRGVDCSERFCSSDKKCVRCTNSVCLQCVEKFYVDPSTQTCVSCARYDPRCLSCDTSGCLSCADLQLNSVRRSGMRKIDQPLPEDERLREFSQTFVYGSQDPPVFDEAEAFTLAPAVYSYLPLNNYSVSCTQGANADASWACTPFAESHRVCGHRGVFSFGSPLYAVAEAAGNITVTVQRSGGGIGSAALLYDLEHITTSPGDVSPTMFYTSSQRLVFSPGVVSLAFQLQIHDNHMLESNKTFRLQLREPFSPTEFLGVPPATLGNQQRTLVTIWDDDAFRLVANLSYVVSPETTLLLGGAAGDQLSFTIRSVLGNGIPGVDPLNEAIFLMTSYIDNDDTSTTNAVSQMLRLGTVTRSGGVDTSLLTCTWIREYPGKYSVGVQLLYPGGLRGDYYGDAWLGDNSVSSSISSPILTRIDRHVNFTWGNGSIIPGGHSHMSVRWSGWLKPRTTGVFLLAVSCVGYARLWVDDVLIVDRWGAGGDDFSSIEAAAGVALTTSKLSSLVLEYRTPHQGDLYARLFWSFAGSAKMEVIPAQFLFYGSHISKSPFTNVPVFQL